MPMVTKLSAIGLALLFAISFGCVGIPDTDEVIIQPDSSPRIAVNDEIRTTQNGLRYILYKPKGYDRSKLDYPLLLFLHSANERGGNIDKVRRVGPPLEYEKGQKQLPFLLVAPQLDANQAWNPRKLMTLIEEVESNFRVDRSRIYVTGMSMGGYGTWILAGKYPERFAAIAPVASHAYVEQSMDVRKVTSWVFHGRHDPLVSVEEATDMVKAIKALGGETHLTIYEEGDHDAWTRTYSAAEFYEWLLTNKQGDQQADSSQESLSPDATQ